MLHACYPAEPQSGRDDRFAVTAVQGSQAILALTSKGSLNLKSSRLERSANYKTGPLHLPTQVVASKVQTDFQLDDYNGDGFSDLYVITRSDSAPTKVEIWNGADRFNSTLLSIDTVMKMSHSRGGWVFRVADYNGDGKADLYAIKQSATRSTRLEVHVMNGADRFQSWLAHMVTLLPM